MHVHIQILLIWSKLLKLVRKLSTLNLNLLYNLPLFSASEQCGGVGETSIHITKDEIDEPSLPQNAKQCRPENIYKYNDL